MAKVRTCPNYLNEFLGSVESWWRGVDCYGELPQLHPRHAQVFFLLPTEYEDNLVRVIFFGSSDILVQPTPPTRSSCTRLTSSLMRPRWGFRRYWIVQNFTIYLQKIIQKCGGYRNFILRSKVSWSILPEPWISMNVQDLAVVDKIVAAKSDLRNAQVYN